MFIFKITCALVIIVDNLLASEYPDYDDYEDETDDESDFLDEPEDGDSIQTTNKFRTHDLAPLSTESSELYHYGNRKTEFYINDLDESMSRRRRYEPKLKTISGEEITDIKDALHGRGQRTDTITTMGSQGTQHIMTTVNYNNAFERRRTNEIRSDVDELGKRPTRVIAQASATRSTSTINLDTDKGTTTDDYVIGITPTINYTTAITEYYPKIRLGQRQKDSNNNETTTTEPNVNEPTTTPRSREGTTLETTNTIGATTGIPKEFDIPALLAIISNLTYEYDTNLTIWVNETLQRMKLPTCKTPEPSTIPPPDYDITGTKPGTIVAKCFVCGLDDLGIPRNAHCSDAFATDFIPLAPIDPTARGRIGAFRKYCRYRDIFGYYSNITEKRAVYGRWTGGCSVRFIDLSGVYTQRTCRNRNRAVMGKHFVSKRMAKLEMSLKDMDNGCIVSPMAVLTPLSRGVSLYARFHACVCSGPWCNTAVVARVSVVHVALVYFHILYNCYSLHWVV